MPLSAFKSHFGACNHRNIEDDYFFKKIILYIQEHYCEIQANKHHLGGFGAHKNNEIKLPKYRPLVRGYFHCSRHYPLLSQSSEVERNEVKAAKLAKKGFPLDIVVGQLNFRNHFIYVVIILLKLHLNNPLRFTRYQSNAHCTGFLVCSICL